MTATLLKQHIVATRVLRPICLLIALTFSVALSPSLGANPADNVHLLLPNTMGAALAAVKQAFENGEIVEMAGNHQADFDSLLSIAIPDISGPHEEALQRLYVTQKDSLSAQA